MIRDDFLTNQAYGFPTRGARRRIDPHILAVVHITANMGSAQNQRDYANREGSNGPSAHYYINRDGGGICAVDPLRYAAWSNGDLKNPDTSNAGVRYLVALRADGYNPNEGCYLEIECVGEATPDGQWTEAQFVTVAGLLAQASEDTGLPINAATVLPHAYINTVDRPHCPSLNVDRHMQYLIELANEGDVMGLELTLPMVPAHGTLLIPKGVMALRASTGKPYKVPADVVRPAYRANLAGAQTEAGYLVDLDGDVAHFIRGSQPVTFTAPDEDAVQAYRRRVIASIPLR